MSKSTDVRPVAARLYFLPLAFRVPLKFGPETLTHLTCARVGLTVRDRAGRTAEGWGETPLGVSWVWPSDLSHEHRNNVLQQFCVLLTQAWADFDHRGHPLEVGHGFVEQVLPALNRNINQQQSPGESMPHLAALVCCSAFDLALHDAYGRLHGVGVYETYDRQFLNHDLSAFLEPADGAEVNFDGCWPQDFLVSQPPAHLEAWHLVGGVDPLEAADLGGNEPDDGHPVLLGDWIRRDGLRCLKIKLRGNDAVWDQDRIVKVGRIAMESGVRWLSCDFNCTVSDPAYVNDILDDLARQEPRVYDMILYVEQPFPYDLESNRIDVHSVAARKPLFMDESAHDWRLVRLGRALGWTGVALKTCKTQSGAILSLCWAKAHGMTLMVQDLTNPMLAQIPHLLLAAHAGTIMGVETNAMQFYPAVSEPEAKVHPGAYRRRDGCVDLSTLTGAGFGYQMDRIERRLPEAAAQVGVG